MTALPSTVAGVKEPAVQPTSTVAVKLLGSITDQYRYPGVGTPSGSGTVLFIAITNTTAGRANYNLYHDEDGSTYNDSTRIGGEDIPLEANQTHYVNLNIRFAKTTATIGVQTTVANALTFTPYVTVP